jgi:hypothetical protein
MKKLLALALMGTLSLTVYGQGVVQFVNLSVGPDITAPITDSTGAPLDGSDALNKAALIGGPTGGTPASLTTAGSGLALLASPDGSATVAGFLTGNNAGIINSFANQARVVTGVDYGGTAMLQVVAWHGAANTWQDAYTAWQTDPATTQIGFSDALSVTLPSSATSPDQAYLVGLQGFALTPASQVPEPSTFALLAGFLALGAVAWRKRK